MRRSLDVVGTRHSAQPAGAQGRRDRKKRLTRQAIGDAAMSLFPDRGVDAVTIADVAQAADDADQTATARRARWGGLRGVMLDCDRSVLDTLVGLLDTPERVFPIVTQ